MRGIYFSAKASLMLYQDVRFPKSEPQQRRTQWWSPRHCLTREKALLLAKTVVPGASIVFAQGVYAFRCLHSYCTTLSSSWKVESSFNNPPNLKDEGKSPFPGLAQVLNGASQLPLQDTDTPVSRGVLHSPQGQLQETAPATGAVRVFTQGSNSTEWYLGAPSISKSSQPQWKSLLRVPGFV